MSRPADSAWGVVHVSHHTFYLVDDGVFPQPPFAPKNGLVLVQPGVAVIFTGASSGVVTVGVQVRQDPPDGAGIEGWDEVIEVSLEAMAGSVTVATPMADAPDLPVLISTGPGHYRIRVHARGRDTAPDVVAFEPSEEYLLTAWPGQPAPEAVYRQTDQYGAGLRSTTFQQTGQPELTAHTEAKRRPSLEANLRRAASRFQKGH